MRNINANNIKRKLNKDFVITTALLTMVFCLGFFAMAINFPDNTDYIAVGLDGYMHTVVIDAGHGGIDGGATSDYCKFSEAELNLKIAKQLQTKLSEMGVGVIMTRKDENSLAPAEGKYFKRRDMDERLKIVEEVAPDLLISIHINKYASPSRRGAQTFYRAGSTGKELAEEVQNSLNLSINKPLLGKEYRTATGDYYLLNKSKCPSIIVECGFISSPEDAKLLSSEDYQAYVAEVVSAGIIKYLLNRNGDTGAKK